jgi:hypothetical protein
LSTEVDLASGYPPGREASHRGAASPQYVGTVQKTVAGKVRLFGEGCGPGASGVNAARNPFALPALERLTIADYFAGKDVASRHIALPVPDFKSVDEAKRERRAE